jgi:hypothetical protein
MSQNDLYNSFILLFVGILIIYTFNTPPTIILISPNVKHYTAN